MLYNAGFGADNVHDLLCPSLATCSGAEQGSQIDPAETPPPDTTLSAQLVYLQANPSLQYNEPGPYGGVPGIFSQFTREAHLHYSVSVVAVISATLTGYLNNTGSEEGALQLIESTPWDMARCKIRASVRCLRRLRSMGKASRQEAISPALKAGWPG